MKPAALIIIFVSLTCSCFGQQEMPLYTGRIPNSIVTENKEYREANALVDSLAFNVSSPTLTFFPAPGGRAKLPAVIICPGGGYHVLLTKREGSDVARAFNKLGISAFVLKYRLPSDKTMTDQSTGPLQDAQQAIKIVRQRAAEWNIDPTKIGIMGFSAGGHLAATAGTHYRQSLGENREGTSLRPDFMLLINPVISFTGAIGHVGSRDNLLGKKTTPEKIKFFSNELQIDSSTPPAFLVHSGADSVVPVLNSLVFYESLLKNHVPAALHIYARGEHGFLTAPSFDEWFGRCVFWLREMRILLL